MTLKMTFLGAGSAFTIGPENYHSNILLETNGDSLLIDAGTDIRHSLREQNLGHKDIKNVYITHLHGDHAGGLEWLALTTHFDAEHPHKPNLFISDKLIDDLWNKTLSGALSTLAHTRPTLNTYFKTHPIKEKGHFTWEDIKFKLVPTIHFYSNDQLMPSYGLSFSYNNTKVLFTSDTQNTPEHLMPYYEWADIIFHDCETNAGKSSVHPHYSDLVLLPASIKNKMWLYHYNPGPLPDAKKDGFMGFVMKGQHFLF